MLKKAVMITVVVLGLSTLSTGCVSPRQAYIEADLLTHIAVAPEYEKYFEQDDDLDEEQKQDRRDLVTSWRSRIDQALESLHVEE
tara:strand:+ start:335 stop:589 length:255 start_codon:yes stop_codon:yes gene_type:complete